MNLDDRDIASYLTRLDIIPTPYLPMPASLATLNLLHTQHLRTVPFENLDVVARRRLSYDLRDLFDKVVIHRRGGWCMETNWLLGHVLIHLGYSVEFIGAGVATQTGFKHDLSHLMLLVRVDGTTYFADVGFGSGSYPEPLPARPGLYHQAGCSYLVESDGPHLIVARLVNDEWQAMYRCVLRPRHIDDFSATSMFHELSAESPFNTIPHCTRLTDEGWAVVSGNRLVLRSAHERAYTLTTPELHTAVLDWVLRAAPRPLLDGPEQAGHQAERGSHGYSRRAGSDSV